jgi:hypothetical protein
MVALLVLAAHLRVLRAELVGLADQAPLLLQLLDKRRLLHLPETVAMVVGMVVGEVVLPMLLAMKLTKITTIT